MVLLLFLQSCFLFIGRETKSWLLVDSICVLFLLYLPSSLSFVSVVFALSASLNDVAPVSPMSFSVDLMKRKK